MNYLLVYGTLKEGGRFNHIITNGERNRYICDVETIPQFTMYDTTWGYPAVVMRGVTAIKGEIWQVDDDTLESIDHLEFNAGFERIDVAPFLRKAGGIHLDKEEVLMYVYGLQEDVKDYDVIESGEW